MRRIISTVAVAALFVPSMAVPAAAQRWTRERVIVVEDDPTPYYDRGYDDGHDRGYNRGYEDGRDSAPVIYTADQCKRRKGKGAVIGALGGGLLGHLSSDRNKLANTAIGALGGGLLGDLVGKRGRNYDC